MSGLPTPPVEDHKSQPMRRQSSKASKQSSRSSTKRSTAVHEHSPISMDGRHKRVWKACERCRMKKTKVYYVTHFCLNIANQISVTGNRLANVVKMMAWYAQLGAGRRPSSSNYLEGMSCPSPNWCMLELVLMTF